MVLCVTGATVTLTEGQVNNDMYAAPDEELDLNTEELREQVKEEREKAGL